MCAPLLHKLTIFSVLGLPCLSMHTEYRFNPAHGESSTPITLVHFAIATQCRALTVVDTQLRLKHATFKLHRASRLGRELLSVSPTFQTCLLWIILLTADPRSLPPILGKSSCLLHESWLRTVNHKGLWAYTRPTLTEPPQTKRSFHGGHGRDASTNPLHLTVKKQL